MKKITALAAALFAFTAASFAYNPPAGGEYVYTFTSPEMLSGGASATGGAEFNIVPASIIFNPALTAGEQRTVADLSASLLINTNKNDLPGNDDASMGFGCQLGLIIPTRYTVFTGTMQGLFADFNNMNLRNTVAIHLGAAKEILEKQFYVGMNLYGGFYTGDDSDFTAGIDLGTLYLFQNNLGFLKNPRLGIAMLNIGKPLNGYYTYGIKEDEGVLSDGDYPGVFTPRLSFASTLFKTANVTGSFSTDASFPTLHNAVFDISYGMTFFDVIHLNAGWSLNILELAEKDYTAAMPSIGVSFKFLFNSKKLGKEDWAQSEIIPSLAWQEVYSGIEVVSLGAKVNLGLADTSAPEIILWDEE
ncbi:hypothetical protein [Treponema sp.]|uniref:hypothetical protein n=1 Tax=Treponema sp. TaxID=166 RepID=UPI0025D49792|nr:hypothetical protein [Treponema sp.]MCR5219358.1 hypothetical protein [Treponema sp.]